MSLIVFVTGAPGTGKSYTANKIIEKYNNIDLVCYDDMKEMFWKKYGFNNNEEKEKVNKLSLSYFYEQLDIQMSLNKNIITEYPLYQRHKEKLEALIKKYNYDAITVLLYGDKHIIYERERKRNKNINRHPSHLVDCYHVDTFDPSVLDNLKVPTEEEFYKKIENKDYNINLGFVYKIDVSDYTKIDLKPLLDKIGELLCQN